MISALVRRELDYSATELASIGEHSVARTARIQTLEPLFWSAKQRSWLFTSYEDVSAALKGVFPLSAKRFRSDLMSSVPHSDYAAYPSIRSHLPLWVGNLDGIEHTETRRALLHALTKDVIEHSARASRSQLSRVIGRYRNEETDIVKSVARPIADMAVKRLLGITPLGETANQLSESITNGLGIGNTRAELDECESALAQFHSAILQLIDDGAIEPSSMLSELSARGGDLRNNSAIVPNIVAFYVAGVAPLADAISTAVLDLCRNQNVIKELRQSPELIDVAVQELLRVGRRVGAVTRYVKQDFQLRGQQLIEGELVQLLVGAANRDPACFPQANSISLRRQGPRPLSFGPGMHHCLGRALATQVMTELVSSVVASDIELIETNVGFSASVSGPTRLVVVLRDLTI